MGFLLLGLDRHPQEVGLRFGGLDRGEKFFVGGHHFGLVMEIEAHPVHLGLVADIRGIDLQGHRKADHLGRRGGVGGGGRRHRGIHRDAVGRQDGLGFQFRQHAPLALQALGQKGPGLPGIDAQFLGQPGRGVLQELQVAGVEIHLHEGVHRLLRGLKGGDAGGIEDLASLLHVIAPHPHRKDRPAFALDLGGQGLGHPRGIGHGLGGQNDHQAREFRGRHGHLHRPEIAFRRGVSQDVDGITPAPVRRQEFIQLLQGFRGQGGGLHIPAPQGVHRHDPRAAGIADDPQIRRRRGASPSPGPRRSRRAGRWCPPG